VQGVKKMFENSTADNARGDTAEFNGNINLDPLIGADPGKVDMDYMQTQVIKLDIADDRLFHVFTVGKVNNACAMLQEVGKFLPVESDMDGVLAVAV
jgi:hypothetical protein